jgi:hypothetical protein
MTYHPRFDATGWAQAHVLRPGTQWRAQLEQEPCPLGRDGAQATIEAVIACGRRSAAAELRLAHAQLSRRFPGESFSLGPQEPSARTAVVLLLALIALVAFIAARSIG